MARGFVPILRYSNCRVFDPSHLVIKKKENIEALECIGLPWHGR